jgi:fucose 4-O-acetylase-like acetyltransferase
MNANATPIPSGTITKSRIEYIDLLKCWAIFSVLWIHSLGGLRSDIFVISDLVFRFNIAFNMPLFFMISGFFFNSSFDLSFKDFFRKRCTMLLIPHIVWVIIVGLAVFAGWRSIFDEASISSQLYALYKPDMLPGLWFLRGLFVTESIVFLSYKIFKKRYAAFIVSVLFVLLFSFFDLNDKVQRVYLPIFWSGILLKAYYPSFCKHLNKILISSGILFLVCFYFFDYTYTIHISDCPPLINVQQSFAEGKIVFDFTNIGVSGFRFLTGIMGSIFFFALFQRCWKKNPITSFLSRYGQLTLGIYTVQTIVLQRVMHNILDLKGVNIWVYRFLVTPITAAFVFFVSVLIIRLIQRNKRLTFILFGSSLVVGRGVVRHENQPQVDESQHQGA